MDIERGMSFLFWDRHQIVLLGAKYWSLLFRNGGCFFRTHRILFDSCSLGRLREYPKSLLEYSSFERF